MLPPAPAVASVGSGLGRLGQHLVGGVDGPLERQQRLGGRAPVGGAPRRRPGSGSGSGRDSDRRVGPGLPGHVDTRRRRRLLGRVGSTASAGSSGVDDLHGLEHDGGLGRRRRPRPARRRRRPWRRRVGGARPRRARAPRPGRSRRRALGLGGDLGADLDRTGVDQVLDAGGGADLVEVEGLGHRALPSPRRRWWSPGATASRSRCTSSSASSARRARVTAGEGTTASIGRQASMRSSASASRATASPGTPEPSGAATSASNRNPPSSKRSSANRASTLPPSPTGSPPTRMPSANHRRPVPRSPSMTSSPVLDVVASSRTRSARANVSRVP